MAAMIISRRRRTRKDIPVELKHRIQSLLPVKEAARTCVLSKSWCHAWSTIPALRFPYQQQQINYNNLIDTTLLRYDRDNLPVETFDFDYIINNEISASLVTKWIRYVSSKTSCLKELSLCICAEIDSFTLPNEIFSNKYLNTMRVHKDTLYNSLWISSNDNPIINCLSLRYLDLNCVTVTENLLDNLFTTCTLLEKINLCCCEGFNTLKVKNLLRLQELKIVAFLEESDILEIDNLPSLAVFHYTSLLTTDNKAIPFNIKSLGSNVTHLSISGVILDHAFFNIIKLNFPLLQSLTLGFGPHGGNGTETFVLTSESLETLNIRLLISRSFNMQVYAPNLLYCLYHGDTNVPSLSFPNTPPGRLQLTMENVNI